MIYKRFLSVLPNHSYPIYISHNNLTNAEILQSHIVGHQVLIVTQQNIANLYLSALKNHLQSYQCDVCYLPQVEQFKNINECKK